MNSAIELHDSRVLSIVLTNFNTIIELDAYVHKSDSNSGIDPGTGWIHQATITVNQSTVEGNLPSFPYLIYDSGVLTLGDKFFSNIIPVPFVDVNTVVLEILFDDSRYIIVSGTGIEIRLHGIGRFIDNFL